MSNVASLKSHLWDSKDVRLSLPPSRQESGGSEHTELSQGVSGKQGNSSSISFLVLVGRKQVAPRSRVGPEPGCSHLQSTFVRVWEEEPARAQVSVWSVGVTSLAAPAHTVVALSFARHVLHNYVWG